MIQQIFKTKKAAREAGWKTTEQWFAKFRFPRLGEEPILVKGEAFFREHQTEEIYSRSKGKREIGRLRKGAVAVGEKGLPRRSVRYLLYRESDFVFEPKLIRKTYPPKQVDLLKAIWSIQQTAERYRQASKTAHATGNHKRARGFAKRRSNLLARAELGLQHAIAMELVVHLGCRGKVHRYGNQGYLFRTRISPPDWMETNQSVAPTDPDAQPEGCRLKDALFTVEQIEKLPVL